MPWFHGKKYRQVYSNKFYQAHEEIWYAIELIEEANLGFDLYCVNIPGKFDRNSVYLAEDGEGFKDEVQRNIAFQRAALEWMNNESTDFDLVHCHDHMSGLIPFFMKYGIDYPNLRETPSFFSIHNAEYHGKFGWYHRETLPPYEDIHGGMLDWGMHIHSLAAAIKCAWKVNTVSPSYMIELMEMEGNLSSLFEQEADKCIGILNGIDNESWDPKTDSLIRYQRKGTWADFKTKNKLIFAEEYGLNPELPWISFIGRFSYQKGVDTIAPAINEVVNNGKEACFIVLGSGNKALEDEITRLENPGKIKSLIMYNERVAHEIYASSDFIMMPSRFEPCGLNQMFSMRYGTVPIVRSTGGLKDTVKEDDMRGTGFRYEDATPQDLAGAIIRALDVYDDKEKFSKLRGRCVRQNFSWEKSAEKYVTEYKKLI